MKLDYTVRFIKLRAIHIVNNVEPNEDRIKKMNQNYNRWFDKLEASILKEGIRNPILVDARDTGLKVRYGGSRLMIAQKYDMFVPTIVADYDEIYPLYPNIGNCVEEISRYFKDKPAIRFSQERLNISALDDYHMKEKI